PWTFIRQNFQKKFFVRHIFINYCLFSSKLKAKFARPTNTTDQTSIQSKSDRIAANEAFFVMTWRKPSDKKVKGRYFAILPSHAGKDEIGKKVPPKNSIGNTIKFASAGTVSTVFDKPEIVNPSPKNMTLPKAATSAISQYEPTTCAFR